MNRIILDSREKLSELTSKSFSTPVVLFKHSTRCSISSMALNRMLSGLKKMDLYILDIISHRDLSNEIAERFHVAHQSPQLIILHSAKCIYDASHFGISPNTVEEQLDILE